MWLSERWTAERYRHLIYAMQILSLTYCATEDN